ncbi:type IV pilus assembly protein PilA [Halopseudomonas salegens]|uniref:Pilin n=2 Tax=Halopseudomonas salegens TaxID=1434072 RepID=A0A1H2FGX8_9GAMM|nr:type IV pilus assembly protein PilA [Halopseudomonas salegens]
MVVVAAIGMLMLLTVQSYPVYIKRSEVAEALMMAGTLREDVTSYYVQRQAFPEDNEMAGIPEFDFSSYYRISALIVESGAIHVTLGNSAYESLHGKVLTFRPAVVAGNPASPIAWLCGYDEPVAGMTVFGSNKTDLDRGFLPAVCRG